MQRTEYRFSADHVSPKWRFENEPITVFDGTDESGLVYYSSHPKLGCSKNYASPVEAIRGMVGEHGGTKIRVLPLAHPADLGHFNCRDDLVCAVAQRFTDGQADWGMEQRFPLPNGDTLYVFPDLLGTDACAFGTFTIDD